MIENDGYVTFKQLRYGVKMTG